MPLLIVAQLWASPVKNLPAIQEAQKIHIRSLTWEEEGVATLSSILAWRIHRQRYRPCGCKESDTSEVT